MFNILSFDCGYDPLAACIITFDLNYEKNIKKTNELLKKQMCQLIIDMKLMNVEERKKVLFPFVADWLDTINQLVTSSIVIKKIFATNILGRDKMVHLNAVIRIARIKYVLNDIDKFIQEHDPIDVVLCENQQIPSKHVQTVESVIMGHYIKPIDSTGTCNPVVVVNPRLKNKITFEHLNHKLFTDKYSSYVANKKHCAANMLYFLRLFDCEHLLDCISDHTKVKRTKYHKDIGDAVCQGLMWYKHNRAYVKQIVAARK